MTHGLKPHNTPTTGKRGNSIIQIGFQKATYVSGMGASQFRGRRWAKHSTQNTRSDAMLQTM